MRFFATPGRLRPVRKWVMANADDKRVRTRRRILSWALDTHPHTPFNWFEFVRQDSRRRILAGSRCQLCIHSVIHGELQIDGCCVWGAANCGYDSAPVGRASLYRYRGYYEGYARGVRQSSQTYLGTFAYLGTFGSRFAYLGSFATRSRTLA